MPWRRFQTKLLTKMQKGPASYEELAKLIVSEYEKAVKHTSSGDKTAKNALVKGNAPLLERYLISIFKAQSKSLIPLDLPNLMVKGFTLYWIGGQLSTKKVPLPPSPGAVFNINVIQNYVTGAPPPPPIPFPLGKTQSTEKWISNLVKVLKQHLLTITGQATLTSAYPQPLPPGWAPGPGINLWTGYDIIDDRTASEQNPSQSSSTDDSIESEQKDFDEYIKQNGPIVSVDKTLKQKPSIINSEAIDFSNKPGQPTKVSPIKISKPPSNPKQFNKSQTEIPNETLKNIENTSPILYSKIGAVPQPAPKDFRGYENAKIPIDKLVGVEKGSRDKYKYKGTGGWMLLHPEAAAQYLKWKEEAIAAGIKWQVTSAYRDFAHQTELQGDKSLKQGTVAGAGSSPHGWAIALDFGDLYQVVGGSGDLQINKKGRETSALYRWMCNSGAKYGWFNPFRLCDGAGLDEMWHWEYHFGTAKV